MALRTQMRSLRLARDLMFSQKTKGLLPYRSRRRASDPAEERRLFYVGMTRAMEELILVTGPEPSPFLADIPPEALGTEQVARPARSGGGQLSLF